MKNIKITKVLLAIDYDPTAKNVAEIGYSIAKSLDAKIALLHVVSKPVYYATRQFSPIMGFTGYTFTEEMQFDEIDDLNEVSTQYLEKTKKHLKDKEIEIIVREGAFAETIISEAKKHHFDLIIMGSHSKNWLDSLVLGSVTEEVLRMSTIPVLVIPTKKLIEPKN